MDCYYRKIRITAICILIAAFCVLTVLVLNDCIADFEINTYSGIMQYYSPELTKVMIIITNMGSATAVIIINLIFLVLPFSRKTFGIPIVINTVLTAGLNDILKIIIARDRPDILWLVSETGYGFPSGHAMNNAALYTMIILIVINLTKNKKIRIPIMICATVIPILIGISRIYLGVHNTGDILAGWIMGVAVAMTIDLLIDILDLRASFVKLF